MRLSGEVVSCLRGGGTSWGRDGRYIYAYYTCIFIYENAYPIYIYSRPCISTTSMNQYRNTNIKLTKPHSNPLMPPLNPLQPNNQPLLNNNPHQDPRPLLYHTQIPQSQFPKHLHGIFHWCFGGETYRCAIYELREIRFTIFTVFFYGLAQEADLASGRVEFIETEIEFGFGNVALKHVGIFLDEDEAGVEEAAGFEFVEFGEEEGAGDEV